MPKRTTLVLDEGVYEKLVHASITRYGTARKISKVVNDLVEGKNTPRNDEEFLRLVYSKKVARTTAAELEKFRKKLSARLER